ncbi:transcription antiterminator LicT [Clostridium botulinum]|uniref:BglG family transcription antiterminator LicT n=1 Tax=Clostridium botulinum TaxID=1491 RepID=UPI000C77A689|nr:PRD domain-containing protein [Clostridium botulinum]AUM98148.1 transcription antiterminator LicT [Clostridium botulinum]
MVINKILNNNAVITFDDKGKEIIIMGKGIAYGKRKGDFIEESKITKKFILSSMEYSNHLVDILSSIPTEYIELCHDIVQYAKQKLSIELDDSLYISLMDHITTSIERYNKGVILKNKLLWEIKHFYKNEYEIGLYGIDIIKKNYGLTMDEDEAGFIALHIVSAEVSNNIKDVYEITGFIQNITNIIKYYFNRDFNTDSYNYYRFITHLKFFGYRVFSKKSDKNDNINNNLLDIIKEEYKEPYLCSLKIKQFIEKKYYFYLNEDEILYLTIHIAKLISDE